MAKRGRSGQGRHNSKVRQIANQYKRKGWNVQADLPEFDQPSPIGKKGYIPDIVAGKAGAKHIIEVETPGSMEKDKNQHEAFRRSAGQQKRTSFEIEET